MGTYHDVGLLSVSSDDVPPSSDSWLIVNVTILSPLTLSFLICIISNLKGATSNNLFAYEVLMLY